jgi:hypothetical protein
MATPWEILKKQGVIPAQAGIPLVQRSKEIPACAGMTPKWE